MKVEQPTAIDEHHLRQWIGREESATDVVSVDLARKFAATFDRDGEFVAGDVAPPLIHFCLAQPAAPTASLGPDGHPARGGFLPPVPLPRRMWAGGRVDFVGDLRVGETMQRISRVTDVVVKEGRSGVLCFVTVEHRVNVAGRTALTERQDIVYRGMDATSSVAAKPVTPALSAAHKRLVDPTAALLFRYSALTFNGHRIHYDKPYVTEVEGYPGLIVHGPLQATLLLQFAGDLHGNAPARFSFRSQSPLFDDKPFQLHAQDNNGKLKLWSATKDGPVAMAAEAEWN